MTVSSELLSGLSRMAAAGCSLPTVRAYTGENFSITLSPIRNIESSKKDIFWSCTCTLNVVVPLLVLLGVSSVETLRNILTEYALNAFSGFMSKCAV